jgi:hypothetical protein
MALAALAPIAVSGLTSLFTKGCGPSAQEKEQFQQQTDIERHLMDAFTQRLSDQKGTIDQLNLGLSNVAAGKFPPGMDPATLAAFTSGAIQRTAASYKNAAQATQAAIAGRGGGAADTTGTLSGPEGMIIGDIAAKGAMEESELLQQVQKENWQTGRENYLNYIEGLSKMAELQDPSRLAGALTESTKAPTQLAETMSQQQSQEAADIGGFAATVTKAGLDAFGAARQPQIKNTGFIPTSQQSAGFFAGGVPTAANPQLYSSGSDT